MKKTLITVAMIALIIPLYAGRADFEPSTTAATPVSVASGTTMPIAVATSSPKFVIKTIKAWITAYSSTPDQTDNTPFITANGTRVRDGVIATNTLPFGTQVKIPSLFGNKIFTVEDRMNIRKKHMFDIWMPSRGAALDFGAHYAEVVVVAQNPVSLALHFPATISL